MQIGLCQRQIESVRHRNHAFLDGAVVRQPSLFIGGAAAPSLEPIEIRGPYDKLDTYLPGLQKKVLLPSVGHSAAEERADQVNELLPEFLEQLARERSGCSAVRRGRHGTSKILDRRPALRIDRSLARSSMRQLRLGRRTATQKAINWNQHRHMECVMCHEYRAK